MTRLLVRARRTAQAVLFAGFLCGCAETAPHTRYPYFLAAGERGPSQPTSFLVAPLDLGRSVPEPLAQGLPVLFEEILAYLRARGHPVVALDDREFAALWSASSLRVGGLSVGTAELLRERFGLAVRELLSQLERRGLGSFDALLIPNLAFRNVEFEGTGAEWDGVYRRLPLRNRPRRFMVDHVAGATTALSLRLRVYSRDGEKRFESYGGLALAYQVDLEAGGSRPELRADALLDQRQLREGIALAFHPFLPLED